MSKKLKPQNDRVLIKPIESEEQRYGSLIVADMGQERPEMGEVIAVGPGRQTEFGGFMRVNAKVGDIVLIPKIGSIQVPFGRDKYFITPDREILATVEEAED